MNRPDLFVRGYSSFTDVLSEISNSMKAVTNVLLAEKSEKDKEREEKRQKREKKRPRSEDTKETSAILTTLVSRICAFEKICAEEEHIDPEDALNLLREAKAQCRLFLGVDAEEKNAEEMK